MPLTAEDIAQIRINLGFVYVVLWSRHRALLHVLNERGILLSEHVEVEMSDWIDQHQQDVWREATDRLKQFFDAPGHRSA